MRAPDLDLDLVRCFLVVSESGGFTAASARLHLSQSAVSLKIQRLESLLGKSVFVRTSRSLSLTAEGEILLSYGRRLLALNQEMIDSISESADVGNLRLGVMPQLGQLSLPDLLTEFKQSHPRVHLSVEVGMTGHLLAEMEAGRLDLVLGAAGRLTGDFIKEERLLLKEEVVWTQASNSAIDPAKDPLPLVLFPEPCGYRKSALAALEQTGRQWRIVYISSSLQSIQAAISADIGIGVSGKGSVTSGMKVIQETAGLPALPVIGVALYRHQSSTGVLIHSLSDFIAQSLNRPFQSSKRP